MSDPEPLLQLLELMLRAFTHPPNVPLVPPRPKVKPGGHPDEIFVDLTDEEREAIECSICYQILKETRQCENRHKFCSSCISNWTASGYQANYQRCPVCRIPGNYVGNNELDELINSKTVKCSLQSCRWKGALKLLQSHKHTTYSDPVRLKQASSAAVDKSTELPAVRNTTSKRPASVIRNRPISNVSASPEASGSPRTTVSNVQTQRQPLGTLHNNNNNNNNNNATINTSNNTRATTTRSVSRSRTRNRNRQNSTSPQRRSNVTATGLNARLTNRARINNSGVVETPDSVNTTNRTRVNSNRSIPTPAAGSESSSEVTEQTTTEEIHVPHPPTTPRPTTHTPRRLPTLPNLISMNITENRASETNHVTDTNNNVSEPVVSAEVGLTSDSPRYVFVEATVRRPSQSRSFGSIRERLNESRQRLDMLMSVFSTELDRGRQDLTSFQEERERRRQEQLAEVRELGHRLSVVATELRSLLSQRRQIRTQMDSLLESAASDPDPN